MVNMGDEVSFKIELVIFEFPAANMMIFIGNKDWALEFWGSSEIQRQTISLQRNFYMKNHQESLL